MYFKKLVRIILRKFGYDLIRYDKVSQWKAPHILSGLKLPLHVMSACKLLPDRDHVLPLVPKGGIAAEVGVAYGDFSRKIVDIVKPLKFYAIDIFPTGPGIEFGRTDITDSFLDHREFFEKKFKPEIDKGSLIIQQGLSWEILETFDNDCFDYVYLDAGHDYDSVKKDILVILKKLKIMGYCSLTIIPFLTGKQEFRMELSELLTNCL